MQKLALLCKFRSTPEEVAASYDITLAILADPESALDVACGKHGVATGMSPGKGYGNLLLSVEVQVAVMQIACNVLCINNLVAYCPHGSNFMLEMLEMGATMKLVVNMIMGSMMAPFSEGLLLSKKVRLDPSVLVEGAISVPMFSRKGPSMVKSIYPTALPLKHQQKDLRLGLALADSVSQSIPIGAATNELYKVAKSHGLSDEDFSAVIEALKVKSVE
ncbi:hypothetical protein Ancab_012532 [Ancistrocladus abbreviatus]